MDCTARRALLGAGLIGGTLAHAASREPAAAMRRFSGFSEKVGVALVGLGSYATGL